MQGQKGGLKDRFISYRLIKARIKREKYELDLSMFEKLLDFDENKKVSIYLIKNNNHKVINNEVMVLDRSNVMHDKIGIIPVKKKEISQELDLSMFDELINDFKKEEVNDAKVVKKIPKEERIKFIKNELDYYQNKIDTEYDLMNLEKYESELFRIKNKIDELKNKYCYSFLDYKFSTITINEIIDELNICKKELDSLENKKGITKQELINKIDTKINLNIEKQKLFLMELKKEIEKINSDVKDKIYLCMVKRMMFNLYRLLIGLYKIEASKKNYLKLNTGVFLIINAIIGMEKALKRDFSNDGYYNYKNYIEKDMNIKDVTIVTYNLLNKSSSMISNLQAVMQKNFVKFKKYSHDYEEIYFKLTKFQEIIDYQSKQCEYLLDKISKREAMMVKSI